MADGLKLAASIAGGLAALWWIDQEAAASISAAGNMTMTEKILNPAAAWLNDLNGRGAAYKPALLAAEDRYQIPRYLLCRLAWQECRFRPDIISGATISGAGAVGIMQIVPKWHPTMTAADCLDPTKAINYGASYLKTLHNQFGSWELALKAYNWGPGNLKKWLARGKTGEPEETRRYSTEILAGWMAATEGATA